MRPAAPGPGSGRELFAALAATGGDDGAPRAGPHAQPEPVRARAAAVVRLEGALALAHFSALLGRRRREPPSCSSCAVCGEVLRCRGRARSPDTALPKGTQRLGKG